MIKEKKSLVTVGDLWQTPGLKEKNKFDMYTKYWKC